MLFLQIRQAEVAVADGRLDEAYQLIRTSDALRSHRRGQSLVTRMIDRLVDRARAHLDGGRASEALLDCEKAQQLGGNLDEVLKLRHAIQTDIVTADRARRQRANEGMIATAAQLVDSAIGRQDLDRAVAELVRAGGNRCADQRLRQLDADVRQSLQAQTQTALDQGRLDQVGPLMDRLMRLDPEALATQELGRAIEQARAAWQSIARGVPDEACEVLQRLQAQLPKAGWIKDALEHLCAADESLRAVRTGALGLLSMTNGTPPRDAGIGPARSTQLVPKAPVNPEGALPPRFLIQVDGAGSYLVSRQPVTTFGPISSSQVPDVGLVTEPGAPLIGIERVEDDYFLRGAVGSPAKLLSNGERIALSSRCRLIFNQPNPSSTTAVLEISAGRFPRADLRRIILLDGELVIGAGATSHIRIDQLAEPIVLHVRENQLWCRNQQVGFGVSNSIGGLSFVLTAG